MTTISQERNALAKVWPEGVSAAEVLNQLESEDDPYADVPLPAETDGPQEPVDDSELEQESHPAAPDEDA